MLTRRDRANALTVCAFRNGHIENLHAGAWSPFRDDSALAKFTRADVQTILLQAAARMAELCRMRDERPEAFRQELAYFCRAATRQWIRSPRYALPVPLDDHSIALEDTKAASHEEEGRALACYAFVDGLLARWHRGRWSPLLEVPNLSRIGDRDMASLMIDASERMAGCLALRWANPARYHRWVHEYQRHVDEWMRVGPKVAAESGPMNQPPA